MSDERHGKDRFDNMPGAIRTFTEAAYLVTMTDLHKNKDTEKLYVMYREGYLTWEINPDNGIANYDENATLTQYSEDVRSFIDSGLGLDDTIGFIAMDTEALDALKQKRGSFNPEYLASGIGIDKRRFPKLDEHEQ